MTDADFIAWLKDRKAVRIALVEAGCLIAGAETTRYLSTKGYTTGPNESPANTAYVPGIAGGIEFTEQLSIDGNAGMSFGDIEIYNKGGERDAWLRDIWKNRNIKVFIGDPRWPRIDFRLIFSGVISDIDARTRDRLNLKLRDKLERLNTAVSDVKLGGTTDNADQLIPLCFGDCHNVTPLLADPGTLTYQVHNGAIESIVEVRDNGVPVNVTVSTATGKFTVDHKPFGAVTASVQGDKPATGYRNTPVQLIKRLATAFGKQVDRFTLADLDGAQMDAFDASVPYPCGVYLDDRANVLEVMQELAASAGAQVVMSREGLLQVRRLSLPLVAADGVPTVITADDMVENSLSPIARPDVVAGVKLAYCRNWTVQNNLQTGIPEAHKQLHAREWLYASAASDNTSSVWRIPMEPVESQSLLVGRQDAEAEARRRLTMWQVQRQVYQFAGYPTLFTLVLGQPVRLFHPRFELAGGRDGIVTALTIDWFGEHVAVEVLT